MGEHMGNNRGIYLYNVAKRCRNVEKRLEALRL